MDKQQAVDFTAEMRAATANKDLFPAVPNSYFELCLKIEGWRSIVEQNPEQLKRTLALSKISSLFHSLIEAECLNIQRNLTSKLMTETTSAGDERSPDNCKTLMWWLQAATDAGTIGDELQLGLGNKELEAELKLVYKVVCAFVEGAIWRRDL